MQIASMLLPDQQYPISPHDSLDRLVRDTKRGGARLMLHTLETIRLGTAARSAPDVSESGYFSFQDWMPASSGREGIDFFDRAQELPTTWRVWVDV
jgi:hypothetical protein